MVKRFFQSDRTEWAIVEDTPDGDETVLLVTTGRSMADAIADDLRRRGWTVSVVEHVPGARP